MKIFLLIGLFLAMGVVGTPFVSAATPVFECSSGECGADGGLKTLFGFLGGTGIIQGKSIIEVILAVIKVLLTLLGTIAFVAFVWAGALYVLAFTDEDNGEKAKKIMISTSLGIVIILISYALTSFLITLTT